MSEEKLIVKNFGPIREAELELGKVNVFIGEQASGKSVLAKLVAICKNSNLLTSSNVHRNLNDYNINGFYKDGSEVKFQSEKYEISFFLTPTREFEIRTKIQDAYLLNLLKEFGKINNSRDLLLSELKKVLNNKDFDQANQLHKKEINLSFQINEVKNKIHEYLITPIYYPTERFLISTISGSLISFFSQELTLAECFITFGKLYEQARGVIKNIIINELGIAYKFEDGGDNIYFNGKKSIALSESSSGIQSIIPLMIVTEAITSGKKRDKESMVMENQVAYETQRKESEIFFIPNNHLFVIEEPELNLYPTMQKSLVEYLIEKCTIYDSDQLILTTHSPYILVALNNLIQAKNVLKKHPELANEVKKIIPEKYHLDYEEVKAYYVADGTVRPIMDEENQLIDANPIDDISEDLGAVFDQLLDLKYQY